MTGRLKLKFYEQRGIILHNPFGSMPNILYIGALGRVKFISKKDGLQMNKSVKLALPTCFVTGYYFGGSTLIFGE